MSQSYEKNKAINGVYKILRFVFLILVVSLYMPGIVAQASSTGSPTTVKSTRYQLGQANVRINLYRTANTSDTRVGVIQKNENFIIRGDLTVHRTSWIKVTAQVNGRNVTGYILRNKTKTSNSTNFAHSRVGYIRRQVRGRRLATNISTSRGVLSPGRKVTVLSTVVANGTRWYRCSYRDSGTTKYGFIPSTHINVHVAVVKTTKYQLGQTSEKLNIYSTANTSGTRLGTTSGSQHIIIRGGLRVNNTNWTKVIAQVNGREVTGYVLTNKIKPLTATVRTSVSNPGSTNIQVTGRRIAARASSSRGTLAKGTNVTVLGEVTVHKTKWYSCRYTISGKSQTGYIQANHITLTGDAEFEKSISGFPSSYKPALRKLHQSNPKWKFVPINTGLNWNTVIQNQTTLGRNTISSTAPVNGISGTYSAPFSYLSTVSGTYDWSKDAYKLFDGTTWYTASADVVKYYMDPRNALSTTQIFQFESLAYNTSQSKNVVSTIFKGTFMDGTYKYSIGGKNYQKNYNDTFMTAGQRAGVSPYFLAARARQELGSNGSQSITGTYPGYEGYYNYFNIGANDSAGGGAIANGLRFAKSGSTFARPWNTPYKSIIGGARYIGESYIKKGQNTLYFQKFSVVNSQYYYWHQYMTNVQAPTSESRTTYNAYNSYGILKDSMVFYIPVYNNMPSSACAKPVARGNPNSYLKSLVVKNGSNTLAFNKTFSYNATSYNMVVPSGVNSISVSATAVSKYAQGITGRGTKNISSLSAGQSQTISVTCTAGNGTKKTYKIKITRAPN